MDQEPSKSSRERPSRNSQRSRSVSASVALDAQPDSIDTINIQDAALLAQFAAAAESGMDIDAGYATALPLGRYPSMGHSGFYNNFFDHDSMLPYNQLPPLSSLDFPWPHIPHHEQYTPHHTLPNTASSSVQYTNSQFPSPPLSVDTSSGTSSRRGGQGLSPGPAHSASSPEVEQTEGERSSMADEKRRRNTAASARFRIKKKQKTINLERSVSDLTGRAEELEREVADLRRENGWLKEIVMLKGTRFAAANLSHRLALNQAAASANAEASSSNLAHTPSQVQGDSEDESGSSESEDDAKKKKGKGKRKD